MKPCPNDPYNQKRADMPCRCDNCMKARRDKSKLKKKEK